jgi:hypothetical protein
MEISLTMKMEWEIFWNCLEEEAEDSVAKLGLSLDFWFECVDNMHLEVHKLTIDGVLRWSMEMILKTVKIAAVNMWLEQRNSGCSKEILQWRFWAFENDLNLLTLLVEFHLLSWVDISVLEFEVVILELISNWHGGFKINWSLQDTFANNTLLLLLKKVVVGSHPVIFNEFSRSLIEGIKIVSAVIVVELVVVIVRTSWHAADDWHTLVNIKFGNLSVKV